MLCLKRSGELIRYVMSIDDIASCADEKFEFSIACAIIDENLNQLYVVPFDTKSIFVWKIVDTKPSIMKIKEIREDENNDVYIYGLSLSPNETFLAAILSDQSVVLYQNDEQLCRLTSVRIQSHIIYFVLRLIEILVEDT